MVAFQGQPSTRFWESQLICRPRMRVKKERYFGTLRVRVSLHFCSLDASFTFLSAGPGDLIKNHTEAVGGM